MRVEVTFGGDSSGAVDAAEVVRGVLRGVGLSAEETKKAMQSVKIDATQSAETTRALDSMSRNLRQVRDEAIATRVELERMNRAANNNGGPGLAGVGRGVLLPAAIGLGVVASGPLGAGAGAGLAAIPGLAAAATGAIGSLVLAFHGLTPALEGNQKAFDQLSPQAQQFVQDIRGLIPWVKQLQQVAQQGILGPLDQGLHQGLTPQSAQAIEQAIRGISTAVGDIAKNAAAGLGSANFVQLLENLGGPLAHDLETVGAAAGHLADALVVVTNAAVPLDNWIAQAVEHGAKLVDQWTTAAAASGQLGQGLAGAKNELEIVAKFVEALAEAAYKLAADLTPVGNLIVGDLTQALQGLSRWLDKNKSEVNDFATGALNALVGMLKAAWPVAQELAQALASVVQAMGGWKTAFEIVIGGTLLFQLKGIVSTVQSLTQALKLSAAAAGTEGLTGALGSLASFIAASPILVALLAASVSGPLLVQLNQLVGQAQQQTNPNISITSAKFGKDHPQATLDYNPRSHEFEFTHANPNGQFTTDTLNRAQAAKLLGMSPQELGKEVALAIYEGLTSTSKSSPTVPGAGASNAFAQAILTGTASTVKSGVGSVTATVLNAAAAKMGIPAAVLAGEISQESGGHWSVNPDSGATGFGQIMPGTGAYLKGKYGYDYTTPTGNVEATAAYLSEQYKKYGSWDKVFAAYYGGSYGVSVVGTAAGNMRIGTDGKPNPNGPYPSVNEYVASVMAKAVGLAGGSATSPPGTPPNQKPPWQQPPPMSGNGFQLPQTIQLALAKAGTTSGHTDDITALRRAIAWIQGAVGGMSTTDQIAAYQEESSLLSQLQSLTGVKSGPASKASLISAQTAITRLQQQQVGINPWTAAGRSPVATSAQTDAERKALENLAAVEETYRPKITKAAAEIKKGLTDGTLTAQDVATLRAQMAQWALAITNAQDRAKKAIQATATAAQLQSVQKLLTGVSGSMGNTPGSILSAVLPESPETALANFQTSMQQLGDTENTLAPKIKAATQQIADALDGKHVLSQAALSSLKTNVQTWQQTITNAVSAAKTAAQDLASQFQTAWQQAGSDALNTLNQQTTDYLNKFDQATQAWVSPAQQLINQLQDEHDTQALNRALDQANQDLATALQGHAQDAQTQLDQIRQYVGQQFLANAIDATQSSILGGAASPISGQSILTTLQRLLSGGTVVDPQEVARAQQAVADAQYNIQIASLQKQATAQQNDWNRQRQEARDTYVAMAKDQADQIQKMSNDWATYFTMFGGDIDQAKKWWISFLQTLGAPVPPGLDGSTPPSGSTDQTVGAPYAYAATVAQLEQATGKIMSKGPVPQFATGGLVTGPTLAIVGEKEPELIMPVSKLQRVAAAAAAGAGGAGGAVHVHLSVDEEGIGQYITAKVVQAAPASSRAIGVMANRRQRAGRY